MIAVIGIDPGEKGGLACVFVDDPGGVKPMAFPMSSVISLPAYLSNLIGNADSLVFLEQQQARPTDGGVSGFKLGQRYGEIVGTLNALELPYQTVRPQVWVKSFGIAPKAAGESVTAYKRRHVEVAQRLFPDINMRGPKGGVLDGIVDALLIAEYGARQWRGQQK